MALERSLLDGLVDARGVKLSGERLDAILTACERRLPDADFTQATFEAPHFQGVHFGGKARFDAATFESDAWFGGATFVHSPIFDAARFTCAALFGASISPKIAPGSPEGATFERRAHFVGTTFGGHANFWKVTFRLAALFDCSVWEADSVINEAPIEDRMSFLGATINRQLSFEGSTLKGPLSLEHAVINGSVVAPAASLSDVSVERATLNGELSFSGASIKGPISLDGAVLNGRVVFDECRLGAPAVFTGVSFLDASFTKARFDSPARFDASRFSGKVRFSAATFEDEVHFDEAVFGGRTDFTRATFKQAVHFRKTVFMGKAHFEEASFEREAHFPEAKFERTALFRDAVFGAFAHFPDANFWANAVFLGADLKGGFRLGPALVAGRLVLNEASLGDADMRVSTPLLCCQRTRFHGPAHLKVRWAEIHLDEGVFDRASSLAFSPSWDEAAEGRLPRCNGVQPGTVEVEQAVSKGERPAMPRMASLRRADVANLTLADIDLSRCEFESTLHLEALRLATLCPFDDTRALSRRWTRRMTIHEERRWRASSPKWGDWKDESVARCAEPTWVATGEMEPWRHSEAERLAKTYRALRKGREDEGNAPGAGDFYYGEMEMRRHGEAAPSERAVIWLYWLVSGYGLRASRALLALGLTVLLFATLFSVFEIREGASFTDDLVFSLKSTTSLLRAPADDLSTGGQVLEIGLRLLGPLFFALAVLSLRGRVKR